MNIKYNVFGTKSGKTVIAKTSLSYGNARAVKLEWEQRGCGLIIDEQRQQVQLDQVELYPVEVLWTSGLDIGDAQRELNWSHDKVIVEEAKVGA